jgi:pilus assembly protein CpaC
VTIHFKEFGVRLNFTPTLMEGGRIHLKVSPEVSALDFANALTVSGFVVPALSTRRVVTEMELGDGQSFAIAGLVDDRLTRSVAKIPWLGDIPILGKLFQSRSINRTKAELLVIVTPRVVKPSPIEPLPQQPQFPYPFMPPAAPEGSGATG